jgi:hypothetical protein
MAGARRTVKHPHADEQRRPSLDRQLEGAGLFIVQDEASDLDRAKVEKAIHDAEASDVPPGPHRVGRRAIAQDGAGNHAARIHAGTKIAEILAFLRKDYRIGHTRDAIAQALGFKLQTVCGRVNDLLTREVDAKPAPLVYENGQDHTGAAYVYAKTPESLSHSDSRP